MATWLRRAVTAAAALVVAAFVAITLRDQPWSSLARLAEPRALWLIAAAVATNAAGLWFGMLAWRALATGFGSRAGLPDAARVFFVGFLAKFVPGRVWTLLANLRMGGRLGLSASRMATLYVLNIAVTSLTGVMTGLVAAPALLGGAGGVSGVPGLPGSPVVWPAVMAVAAVPVVACFARPGLAHRLADAAARLLRRPEPATRAPDASVRWAIALQTLSWLLSGVQLWLLAVALGAPPAASLPVCVGAFGVAAVAGYLMILVPDGLGVREAVLLVALTSVLPLPAAGVAVMASRLLCTVTEVAVAGLTLLAAQLRISLYQRQQEGSPWPISTSQSSSTTTRPTSVG
ncbi:lysylphosphatidylglycerol synthase domain-containing protein [Sphaerisporangium sp. NPDC004334]